jgi:hypothetical protein
LQKIIPYAKYYKPEIKYKRNNKNRQKYFDDKMRVYRSKKITQKSQDGESIKYKKLVG